MTRDLVIDILEVAVKLARMQSSGKVQQEGVIAELLLNIIRKAMEAYRQQTGKQLDPSLITVAARVGD